MKKIVSIDLDTFGYPYKVGDRVRVTDTRSIYYGCKATVMYVKEFYCWINPDIILNDGSSWQDFYYNQLEGIATPTKIDPLVEKYSKKK